MTRRTFLAEGLYGDVVEEIDWSVGEVMAALRQHGLERNTLALLACCPGIAQLSAVAVIGILTQ